MCGTPLGLEQTRLVGLHSGRVEAEGVSLLALCDFDYEKTEFMTWPKTLSRQVRATKSVEGWIKRRKKQEKGEEEPSCGRRAQGSDKNICKKSSKKSN